MHTARHTSWTHPMVQRIRACTSISLSVGAAGGGWGVKQELLHSLLPWTISGRQRRNRKPSVVAIIILLWTHSAMNANVNSSGLSVCIASHAWTIFINAILYTLAVRLWSSFIKLCWFAVNRCVGRVWPVKRPIPLWGLLHVGNMAVHSSGCFHQALCELPWRSIGIRRPWEKGNSFSPHISGCGKHGSLSYMIDMIM